MKKILLLLLSILVFSCNTATEKTDSIAESNDSMLMEEVSTALERIYPATKTTEKFDTIIAEGNLEIIIVKQDLDTYITNEYIENGKKQIEKYRDAEINLIIKKNSDILLDTLFAKEQFYKHADKAFITSANFHNYWFNSINKNKIELFGVISQPETDNALAFYHYFDLTSGKMAFVEHINEEN